MNNIQKYLPSKKFVSIVLIIVIFIALFFAVKGIISLISNRKGSLDNKNQVGMTVETLTQKDSNDNGIADWEEQTIWGLNPTKNGAENKEFILAKKKSMEQSGAIISDDSKTITQNDMLSRQFFATIMSLQQTGSLDDTAISSISESIGQEIKTLPIPDTYNREMLSIRQDSKEAHTAYFNAFSVLVDKYANQDIGGELTIISQGIVNQDPQALYAARTIASAYRSFGKDLIKIPVPSSAALAHLDLANSYEKTAQSIEGLTQVLSDPIIGMRSILNYKKYTDTLVSDLEKIKEILQ